MLVLNKPETPLKHILRKNVLMINPHEDQEKAVRQMHHYNLMSAPVTDESNHFLGVITADDMYDILEEEASEDVYKMSGVGTVTYSYFETPLYKLVWQRSIWLVSLLLLQSVSSPKILPK